ncbi:MAG: polyphosphate kinase 2 family protein [bacterium]|nr:polyphosphate kinase 2 family protein [bacterium]
MDIRAKDYRLPPGGKVDSAKWPTQVKAFYRSRKQYQKLLAGQVEGLGAQQRLLHATGRHAVLLVLQGMDTAGKDGIIRHVLSGVNPQGLVVHGFKQPSAEELAHDFLWRTACRLPERGRIGVFNRSHYEEVLIVRVHPELLNGQGLPADRLDPKTIWTQRFRSIVEWEDHLHRSGTRLVKIFLHVSKEVQRQRLLERLDDPHKQWKFSVADVVERGYWDAYQLAYEQCLGTTSTEHAPWHIVPADDKANARLITAQILLDALVALNLALPATSARRRRELKRIRKQL